MSKNQKIVDCEGVPHRNNLFSLYDPLWIEENFLMEIVFYRGTT